MWKFREWIIIHFFWKRSPNRQQSEVWEYPITLFELHSNSMATPWQLHAYSIPTKCSSPSGYHFAPKGPIITKKSISRQMVRKPSIIKKTHQQKIHASALRHIRIPWQFTIPLFHNSEIWNLKHPQLYGFPLVVDREVAALSSLTFQESAINKPSKILNPR